MKDGLQLRTLLPDAKDKARRQSSVFAFFTLGVVESLASGLLSPTQAVRLFFHADNCMFVRKQLHDKSADKIMSRGVQLPDLFTVLPAEDAHREFQHELSAMRSLCLKLLEGKKLVA